MPSSGAAVEPGNGPAVAAGPVVPPESRRRVEDRRFITDLRMPLTPHRVWKAIERGRAIPPT